MSAFEIKFLKKKKSNGPRKGKSYSRNYQKSLTFLVFIKPTKSVKTSATSSKITSPTKSSVEVNGWFLTFLMSHNDLSY